MRPDTDKKIGLCMVTGVYYPEISGGGLQCHTLIDALMGKGFRFFVLTTTKEGLPSEDLGPDLKVIRVARTSGMSLLSKSKIFLQLIYYFLKIKDRINIVHLHGFTNKTMLFILLAKIFRKKIIQKVSSLGEDDPGALYKRSFGRLKQFFFSRSDLFISVNPAICRGFLEAGFSEDKIVNIANGVDTKRFSPVDSQDEKAILKRELGLPTGSILILFVGFFSKDKAPDILFEAFKRIRHGSKEDVRVLFLGTISDSYFEIDVDLVKRIKEEVKSLGMEKEVIFIDKTLEIEKYYKASDIFVLPSLREGLPNALLEAMSTALPCVSSDLEGVTNYLISDKKEGLIFKPGDAEGLYKAIYEILNNKDMALGLGRSGRKKILENFSIDNISGEYVHIYNKLIEGNKC